MNNRKTLTNNYHNTKEKIENNPRFSKGEKEVFLYRNWLSYVDSYCKLIKKEKEQQNL